MAKKVEVIIDGKETVSGAADKADFSLSGFMNKIPGWAKGAAVLTAAYAAISGAISAVSDFVMDSFAVYDRYAASQTRMAAQSKLTGVSLDDLKEAAKRAREEFGLSSETANEAAITTAKYASRAGDASLQNKLLAASLDLGAAAGLTAAESMQAMEQGLRGQDEGFDKLLGKNPSTIWKEYADANGLAVGKMTDTQKRMAELTAIVDAGNIVQGSYNERLQTGAGQQEQMANKLDNAKIAFGAALQPIRMLVIQGLMKLIEIATPVVQSIGEIVNAIGVKWALGLANARGNVGGLVEVLGRLVNSDAMQEWGKSQVEAADKARESIYKMMDTTEKAGGAAGKAAGQQNTLTGSIKGTRTESEKAAAQSVKDAAAATAATDAWEKSHGALKVAVRMTTTAIYSLSEAAKDQLPSDVLVEAERNLKAMAKHAGEVEARLTGAKPPLESGAESAKNMAGDVATVARGALDTAKAFGIIDDEAATALGSVVNIADSITGMLKGGSIFAGVAGILGGVASIVSQMMSSDAERRRLLSQNNDRLRELRDRVGDLDLNVTGDDFNNTKTLLTRLGPLLDKVARDPTHSNAERSAIFAELSKSGIRAGDLARIAEELGINIKDKNGNVLLELLPQLLEALNSAEFGTFGQDFASQLRSIMSGFDINNTSDAGQVGGLGALGAQFSPLLKAIFNPNDLGGSRVRLQEAFSRLQSGQISAGELGGLTGNQFLELITDLIGRIDGLAGTGTGATGGAPSSPPATGDGTGAPTGTDGPVSAPAKTLDNVVAEILTQTERLGAFHATSLGFQERTANATEATAQNTLDALKYLGIIAAGGRGGDSDDEIGRRLSIERRLQGNPAL